MPENPDAIDPYKYDFTIPAELAAGKYTLAWTWFNKVGNREMYMNCAPLQVTGSGGSENHLDTLPDMFVANIGPGCGTLADTDVSFPNPGQDVDKLNGATDAFKAPVGTACQAAGGGGGGGKQPVKTSAVATKPIVTPTPTPTPTPGNGNNGGGGGGKKSIPGGVFITVSDEPAETQPVATQPAITQPATTLVPVVSTPVVSNTPVATPVTPEPGSGSGDGSGSGSGDGAGSNPGNGSGPGDGGSSGGFASGTACTAEGDWNCIAGTSFQRCASGTWSAPQGLSAGVTCTPGQSTDINMSAKRGGKIMRRSLRIRV